MIENINTIITREQDKPEAWVYIPEMIANACCLDFSWLLSLKLQTLLFVTFVGKHEEVLVDFQGSFHAKINRETVTGTRGTGRVGSTERE